MIRMNLMHWMPHTAAAAVVADSIAAVAAMIQYVAEVVAHVRSEALAADEIL